MKQWMCAVVVASLMVGLVACFGQSTPQPQATRAAVVDLDAVAKDLGRDQEIANKLKEATQQINEQLIKAANDMKSQLEIEQSKLDADAPVAERRRLAAMVQQANQNVRNNKMMAQYRQQQVRAALIVQFRNEVKPFAEKVAKTKGASVVLLPTDNVLWYDPVVDITEEVAGMMKDAADTGDGE